MLIFISDLDPSKADIVQDEKDPANTGIAVSDIEISWTGLQASRKQYEKVQGESAL